MPQILRNILLFSLILGTPVLMAQELDHQLWDKLLKQHVAVIDQGAVTSVDYAGFAKDRGQLQNYLKAVAGVSQQEFDKQSKPAQLALLINLYNAATVELILSAYPDLDSIKDLGSLFRSPWKKDIVSLFGDKISLDDLEHGLIRGERYQDPRIHFAVNCASIGCPALRAEAYQADKLAAQLEQQTQLFLSDRSRNRFVNDQLEVSSIFKWYREDFEKGWLGYQSLEQFLSAYADALDLKAKQVSALKNKKMEIDFLDYDWRLNGQ